MTKQKVYVQKPWEQPSIALFQQYGFPIVDNIKEADIVVFNGGEDVHPSVYKQKPVASLSLWLNEERDALEIDAYNQLDKKQFKFGICRGGQLLNVMNGGKLWQHVTNHNHDHHIIDVQTEKSIWSSSVHHQMMVPSAGAEIVAYALEANQKIGIRGRALVNWHRDPTNLNDPLTGDPEVVWYKNDRALCIQGHPEYSGFNQFTDYCMSLIERFY